MSASASSKILVGTVIPLILEKYEGSYPRFDPKTGEPKVLKSPSLQVTLLLGKDQVPINLPEDANTFVEDVGLYEDFGRWSRRRLAKRLRSFFLQQLPHDLVVEDYDSHEFFFCLINYDQKVFLGKSFLCGNSYCEEENLITFNSAELQQVIKETQEQLNEWSLTKYSIELPIAPYLRTTLG